MIKNKNIFITGLNGSIAKRFIYLLDKSLINSTFYVSTSSKIFNLNLVNKIKTFKLDENFKDIKKCKKVLKTVTIYFICHTKIQKNLLLIIQKKITK